MSNVEIVDVSPAVYGGADQASRPGWEPLSLLGGPLHEAGKRLRLVRGSNTTGLGLAIGGALWAALLLLAAVTGDLPRIASIASIAIHLRLLIVIPLMFVCETWLTPRAAAFAQSMVNSAVIPPSDYSALRQAIGGIRRLSRSWLPDATSALVAIALIAAGSRSLQFSTTPGAESGTNVVLSVAIAAIVAIFRFLLFRWIFRIGLWWRFLWRVSRMKLHLVPIHPDRVGGLGELEMVQFQFLPLIAALSVLLSSTHAEELARGAVPVSIIYAAAAESILLGLFIAFLPLSFFSSLLMSCRERGYADYMSLASRYVGAFQNKWLGPANKEELLGTADIQSLADLSNSVSIVRDMRAFPASMRLILQVVAVALIPLIPLSLFKQSLPELLQKIILRLLGG